MKARIADLCRSFHADVVVAFKMLTFLVAVGAALGYGIGAGLVLATKLLIL